MATNNATIIGDFLMSGTNDYQQRIPNPTQAGVTAVARALFDPTNRDIYNNFCQWLITVPAFSYTRAQSFENGLKSFVKKIQFGNGLIENQVGWVKAHAYDPAAETLLKKHFPEGAQAYHTQNRQDVYPISLSRDALRTAFNDEYGLNQLAAQIMQAPINSDEYDTYRLMLNLLAEYDANSEIYTVHYDSEPTSEEEARSLLADMVAWSKRITFPSALYNASGAYGSPIATFSKPSQMVLMVTPEIYGLIGVKGLGMLFNIEQGEIPYRTIVVDEFPMPGVFAVLCDESWFQVYDTEYGTYSFFDPETLTMQYFLQHWGVYSASPFAPILAFGTRAAGSAAIVTETVTGVDVSAAAASVELGGSVALSVALTGTVDPSDEGVEVEPDSVTWAVTAMRGSEAVKLNSRTRVDYKNILHVQSSGELKSGDVLTIMGTATYKNPSATATDTFTDSVTVTID